MEETAPLLTESRDRFEFSAAQRRDSVVSSNTERRRRDSILVSESGTAFLFSLRTFVESKMNQVALLCPCDTDSESSVKSRGLIRVSRAPLTKDGVDVLFHIGDAIS